MKHFRNRSVLFKLIISFILCCSVFCELLTVTVNAKCNNKHDKVIDTQKQNLGTNAAGQPMTKVIYTYEDGCKKIEETGAGGLTTQDITVTWEYNDGSKESDKGVISGDAEEMVKKQNESDEDLKHAEASQGGKLLQPVIDLVVTLGDGIMYVIQRAVIGTGGNINLDITGAGIFAKILGILAGILVIVAISIVTAGIGALLAAIPVVGPLVAAAGSSGIISMVVSIATVGAAVWTGTAVADGVAGNFLPDITVLPTYSVSPEEIFEGKLLLFDINFFKPKELWVKFENGDKIKEESYNASTDSREVKNYFYYDEKGEEVPTSKQNTALQLSSVISKWYYSIRNIALIAMMLILVYIGIRMMLCSIASEKSKYKKMLGDWVISMLLVFMLHYIMVFAVYINESIVKLIGATTDKNQSIEIISLKNMDRKKEFIKAVYKTTGGEANEYFIDANGKAVYSKGEAMSKDPTKDESKIEGFAWPTNLVGRMRILCQYQNGSAEYVGYGIAYLVLVFYTIFFAFTYLKRVLYMAFLTIIAPLVAMTYSLDKISDGKAQAFNMWLKEYIFNLLIQPIHLLLYMVLISMAYDLAATNIIYTLVAIGFMMPAEKLIRKMFGVDGKASTPGFLGGAAGAAVAMSGMQKLAKIAGRVPGPKGGDKSSVGKLNKGEDDPKGLYDRSADEGFNDLFKDDKKSPTDDAGSENPPTEGEKGGANNPTNRTSEPTPLPNQGTDYDDIDLAEQNANPIDFLNDEEKNEYEIAKGRAQVTKDFSDYSKVSEMEKKAEKLKADHFQRERQKHRMLEESKRRAEAQKKSEGRIPTMGRIASRGIKGAVSPKNWGGAISRSVKLGTKLTGTALGAGIGATLGVASGDIGKVVQNVGLGMSAGTAVGNGIAGMPSAMGDRIKASYTEYNKERYGENYSKHQKAKLDEKFMKDKEARKFYERECSSELEGLTGQERKEKLDEIMKDAIKYRQHGVTDNSLIVKARNLDVSNRTSDESIGAAMLATKAKDMKGIESYQKDLTKLWGEDRAIKVMNGAKDLKGLLK